MIERIVVPLDGSLTAESILPQVRRVLYRSDSEVILVRAVVPPAVENSIVIVEAELGAAREYLLGQSDRLEKAGVRVKHVARVGSPVGVILDVAEEQRATMIALATHGASGLKRLLFGSVAEALIRRSPLPVLLVRPFWSYELTSPVRPEQTPIRKLLMPVDGSERSLDALPGVVELAELFDTQVVLLRVLEEGKRRPPEEVPEKAEEQLRSMAKAIERKGVETQSLIVKGDPAGQILKAVGAHEIDMIAMATHGRRGLARVTLGSVTEKVLRSAPVPILVTRSLAPAKEKKPVGRAKAKK
jgi:nucleotide-binding universal stress UspA family protein